MAELRRLFINNSRMKKLYDDLSMDLTPQEVHYLSRVLRLRRRDSILITDGLGSLWEATIAPNKKIRLNSPVNQPIQEEPLLKPLICLAVVIPKKGFSDILRMSCEIGIDIVQPLLSERSICKEFGGKSSLRWDTILNEAIEQSERLWKPELRKTIHFNDWVLNVSPDSAFSIGAPRYENSEELESWLGGLSKNVKEVWIVIGPEGGWSNDEFNLAEANSLKRVRFGQTILRTSTAAISASQLLASWRRMIK